MPINRLPAIADRAVWEKVTNGLAGIRWDSVIRESMEGYTFIGGNQEEILQLSIENFAGYKTEK